MRINFKDAPELVLIGKQGRRTFSFTERSAEAQGLANALRERLGTGTKTVGLVFPTSEGLFVHWFAVLLAGMEPCILHYPTAKTNRHYYEASLRAAVRDCQIDLVLHSGEIAAEAFPHMVFKAAATPAGPVEAVEIVSIVQLSSGTTGTRKGIRFTGEQLEQHALNYNQVLQLEKTRDTIVSWLPLYHDMGFIACWCMPLFLGVRVVMMDPIHWVRTPQLLYDAIKEERGTVVFMPNFGFEVMARSGRPGDLSSVRRWISCSEPTRAHTMRKFAEATGTPVEKLANCYAMAENVFAITQQDRFSTFEKDGREFVSCGSPVPGTEVRLHDEEIWVRSSHSLSAYLGAPAAVDPDGFYFTGDLGFWAKGELFVTGRKNDIFNIAGRKFLASEIDDLLQQVWPEARGREAALAVESALTGTEQVVVAVERPQYWAEDFSALTRKLGEQAGIENLEVRGVPTGFLTKTTSGKINRKASAADYRRMKERRKTLPKPPTSSRARLLSLFGHLPPDVPCGTLLDSLGLTSLRIVLDEHSIAFQPQRTLRDWLALVQKHDQPSAGADEPTFNIVACVDRNYFGFVDEGFLRTLSALLNVPVNFEHVCVPPASILINDLIFDEWFAPRRPELKLEGVRYVLDRLRGASLILFDDSTELHWPHTVRQGSCYPALSHSFSRDPSADYLAVRWARYTAYHHELPVEVVKGSTLERAGATRRIDDLAKLLEKPIAKIATRPSLTEWTKGWDIQTVLPDEINHPANETPGRLRSMRDEVLAGLMRFITQRQGDLNYSNGGGRWSLKTSDQAHFCSWLVPHDAVAAAASRYQNYVVCGLPSSLPILRGVLDANHRKYVYSSTLDIAGIPHDAVIQAGSWGQPVTSKPVYMLMDSGLGLERRALNLPEEEARLLPQPWGEPDEIMEFARNRPVAT